MRARAITVMARPRPAAFRLQLAPQLGGCRSPPCAATLGAAGPSIHWQAVPLLPPAPPCSATPPAGTTRASRASRRRRTWWRARPCRPPSASARTAPTAPWSPPAALPCRRRCGEGGEGWGEERQRRGAHHCTADTAAALVSGPLCVPRAAAGHATAAPGQHTPASHVCPPPLPPRRPWARCTGWAATCRPCPLSRCAARATRSSSASRAGWARPPTRTTCVWAGLEARGRLARLGQAGLLPPLVRPLPAWKGSAACWCGRPGPILLPASCPDRRSTWWQPMRCPPTLAWRRSAATLRRPRRWRRPQPRAPPPTRPAPRRASWPAPRPSCARTPRPCRAAHLRSGLSTTPAPAGPAAPLCGSLPGAALRAAPPRCSSAWRAARRRPSPTAPHSRPTCAPAAASACASRWTSRRC